MNLTPRAFIAGPTPAPRCQIFTSPYFYEELQEAQLDPFASTSETAGCRPGMPLLALDSFGIFFDPGFAGEVRGRLDTNTGSLGLANANPNGRCRLMIRL
jgi:hypothetical protein